MASWPFLLTARPHCSSFSLNFNPVNWYFVACFITDLLMNSKIVKYWRRQWHPTPVLLSGKSMDGGAWLGCSPWGREELDMTEWLPFHFSLSCIGAENGSPLQCSCLENPRDGGAWWAAVYGVARSQTRLKQLSSSSSSTSHLVHCIGFPGASQVVLVIKNLPANAGDIRGVGSIPGSGRSPGGGRGNPLQDSCLENPRDKGAWGGGYGP